MSSLDILYYSLAIGFLVFIGLFSYLLYLAIKAISIARNLTSRAEIVKRGASIQGIEMISSILAIIGIVSNLVAFKRR